MNAKPILFLFTVLLSTHALPGWADDEPDVASIDSINNGQSYGQWAADWWRWAFSVPGPTNPLLDTSGADCGQRQTDNVWFLAGSFGSDPVVRECTVPAGKALFFPLINSAYGAFLDDDPATTTEEFVREASKCFEPVTSLSLIIDGHAVSDLWELFTGEGGSLSPVISVQMPPNGVLEFLFGLDESIVRELVLTPFAEEGYYVYLEPLPPGEHLVQFAANGCAPNFSQNVTYYLTITGDDDGDEDDEDEHDND